LNGERNIKRRETSFRPGEKELLSMAEDSTSLRTLDVKKINKNKKELGGEEYS